MALSSWGAKDWFGFVDTVATDSSTITQDTLPPFYQQVYSNDTDTRLYFNVNNSIYSIDLTSSSS